MKSILQVFTFDVLSKVVLGVAGVVVIRYLPPGEYARYTMAIAVAGFAGQVLATAVNRVYIVGHARVAGDDPLHAMLGFQLLVLAAAGALCLPLMLREPVTGPLVLALVAAMCLSEFAKTYFQRDLRFRALSAVEVARSVAFMGALLALVWWAGSGIRAWQVLLLQALAFTLVFAAGMAGRLRWRAVLHAGAAVAVMREILRTSYRDLFVYFTLLSLLSQVSIGMLRLLSDDLELASYGSAFRYYALLMLALAAVDRVLLPMLQNAVSLSEMRRVLERTRRLALLAAGPVLLGAWVARWVLPAIDLGKYPAAVPTFRILAVSALLSLALSPYANLLLRQEEFRPLMVMVAVSVGLNVLLAVPLITAYGAPGAAAAYLLGYTVLQGGCYLRARRLLKVAGDAGAVEPGRIPQPHAP